ncbi:hypothetical protein C8F04DRAFT_1253517 [Mycena alexandri]|uniref:HD domain-containing protein n=1 Tax=Mycena alexandri TaxID=1745969 RepID=A0AAD6XAM4_9AGAR|nr:hypothetical protein C8F04DRAFT_1253517 [Mycena alexandri]
MAAQLQTYYSEPQRHYHTLAHITYMLKAFDASGRKENAIELAIWFHDCVYDPLKGSPWNERQSIQVWEEFCDSIKPKAMTDLKEPVSVLIEATILHRLPDTLPEGLTVSQVAVFLDLDMSILADSPSAYETYSQQIRQEYLHFPDKEYRLGRSKVLQSFLLHDRIFLGEETEAMEERARVNIQGELSRLQVA